MQTHPPPPQKQQQLWTPCFLQVLQVGSSLCILCHIVSKRVTSRTSQRDLPGSSVVKNLPMQETWVRSLGQEDPLEKEMATHYSILAWRIPWREELDGLQSMGLQKSQIWLATKPTTHLHREKTSEAPCLYSPHLCLICFFPSLTLIVLKPLSWVEKIFIQLFRSS